MQRESSGAPSPRTRSRRVLQGQPYPRDAVIAVTATAIRRRAGASAERAKLVALGAALLRAGRHAEAEAVYRRALEDYPHNGWSMFGLVQSLDGQGKSTEAGGVRDMFEHVWERADVKL